MRKRNGFTLIEMLVVIGIIALLTVFLVPTLFSARDRAKEASVKGVMRTVQLALEAYNTENGAFPPETSIALESLCNNYLLSGDYIAAVPENPFTGAEYDDSDASGKIMYSSSDSGTTYTLTGYGRGGLREIQELTNM